MIEPVHNQNYYGLNNISTKTATTTEGGEKFSLDYQKDENQRKANEKKTKDAQKRLEESGVKVDISSSGRQYEQPTASSTGNWDEPVDFSQSFEQARNFFETLRQTMADFLSGIRDAIVRFWNSEEAIVEDTSEIAETDVIDNVFKQPKAELATVEEPIAAEAEKPSMARNSDLLTKYDRSGKLVQVNGADRVRILKGDGSQLSG